MWIYLKKLLIVVSLSTLLIGCSHFTEDREVICKVDCTNCEHVVHECNGSTDVGVTEVK